MTTLKKNRERIKEHQDKLQRDADKQRTHETTSQGGDDYINRHNATAGGGWADSDRLQQQADLSKTTGGKVANQLGLSFWSGVYKTKPVALANVALNSANALSLTEGGQKVVETGEDKQRSINNTRRMFKDDSAFTNDDGSPTPLGESMKWMNELFEAAPDVAINTLSGGTTYGASKLYTGFATSAVMNSYLGTKNRVLAELNGLSGDELMNNPAFVARYKEVKAFSEGRGEKLSRKQLLQRSRNALADEAGVTEGAIELAMVAAMKQVGKLTDEEKKSLRLKVSQDFSKKLASKAIKEEVRKIIAGEEKYARD